MPNPEQSQTLSTPRNVGEERTQRLSDKVEKATEQVAESALAEVQQVRDRAQSGLERGRNELGQRLRRVGSAVRATGDVLREDDDMVARYATVASDQIERAAAYVSNADLRSVARDVERLARTQPVPFFGGAFVIGLIAGRFLRSSGMAGDTESDTDTSSRGPARLATRSAETPGWSDPDGWSESESPRMGEEDRNVPCSDPNRMQSTTGKP
jgi:ElaB/YqjD/DUF883 family membrane-anchored ribosome-binding protein